MEQGERPRARLYLATSLAVASIRLGAERAHYLRHVLRMSVGDKLAVFNATDGECEARVGTFGKGWCDIAIGAQRRAPRPESDLWLLFAPIKRTRIDGLIETATELGVSEFRPVFTQHTAMTRIKLERLKAIAIEAAEQCERLTVPEIHPPQSLADALCAWPPGRLLLLCDETGSGEPIGHLLTRQKPRDGFAILIGPEGGFSAAELDGLRKLPFVTPVGLGPRVLRADTAALAALSVVQALAGDGRMPTPGRAQ
ncbi:MAG TPA: 16S rRNA (uracil(1498)-N(3))-methyltransferase [Alphaproteobacteria bacterium]|nr:16S rRNA (uracil(1498)-N(3))-methyltransferase [Alphaproteobacteria bacterium]